MSARARYGKVPLGQNEEGGEATPAATTHMGLWALAGIGFILAVVGTIIAIVAIVKAYAAGPPGNACSVTSLVVNGVCNTPTAVPAIGLLLCKQGHAATIEIKEFTCNGTANGTSLRTAPLYLSLPNNFQPNTSFGQVAGR
jgi:hypothetical protein